MSTFDEIIHGVYLGDWQNSIDEKSLDNCDIKAVLCINNIHKDIAHLKMYEKLGIQHYHIDAYDSEDTNLKKWFHATNNIIAHHVIRGQRILVHCTAGVSRSATIVIAYLIYISHCRGNKRPNKAIIHALYKFVRNKRNCVLPNSGFYNQLIDYEKSLLNY